MRLNPFSLQTVKDIHHASHKDEDGKYKAEYAGKFLLDENSDSVCYVSRSREFFLPVIQKISDGDDEFGASQFISDLLVATKGSVNPMTFGKAPRQDTVTPSKPDTAVLCALKRAGYSVKEIEELLQKKML